MINLAFKKDSGVYAWGLSGSSSALKRVHYSPGISLAVSITVRAARYNKPTLSDQSVLRILTALFFFNSNMLNDIKKKSPVGTCSDTVYVEQHITALGEEM